jgi:hypothetical protein
MDFGNGERSGRGEGALMELHGRAAQCHVEDARGLWFGWGGTTGPCGPPRSGEGEVVRQFLGGGFEAVLGEFFGVDFYA